MTNRTTVTTMTLTTSLFQTTVELDRFHVFLREGNNTVSRSCLIFPIIATMNLVFLDFSSKIQKWKTEIKKC